jgi:hypothetical protein
MPTRRNQIFEAGLANTLHKQATLAVTHGVSGPDER